MSKTKRVRKAPKQSNRQKRAAHVNPEPQIPAEVLEEHYRRNTQRLWWGVTVIMILLAIIYVLAFVDVSGCAYVENYADYELCQPYSMLEHWAGVDKLRREAAEREAKDSANKEAADGAKEEASDEGSSELESK